MRAPLAGVLLGAAVLAVAGTARAQTAHAPILRDIRIDGDLSDWPDDMVRYPIRHQHNYGKTDIDGLDLSESEDLSPHFRVGYSPEENLVYVAVEAVDDSLVVGTRWAETDACEVYVQGACPKPLQYAMVPGLEGSYHNGGPNPTVFRHNIAQSRTRGAFGRDDELTIYEWAIEVHDLFPDKPSTLEADRMIGFDVVVVDKDGTQDHAAWVAWGAPLQAKYDDGRRIGRLLFMDEEAPRGFFAGFGEGLGRLAASAGRWLGIFLAVALAGGTGYALRERLRARGDRTERLHRIEERLADTQDVMIELSEKMDRLEREFQDMKKN